MRWPWSRGLPSSGRRHRRAMGELARKDAEISSLLAAGDAGVLSLLGSVDRFSAEIAAVITGHDEEDQ